MKNSLGHVRKKHTMNIFQSWQAYRQRKRVLRERDQLAKDLDAALDAQDIPRIYELGMKTGSITLRMQVSYLYTLYQLKQVQDGER